MSETKKLFFSMCLLSLFIAAQPVMAMSEKGRQLSSQQIGDTTTSGDAGQVGLAQPPSFALLENILGKSIYLRMIESDNFILLEGLLERLQQQP
jgi:hypothetical protein